MITESFILQELGDKYLTYATNKNRGGFSNEKGNTFENFFATYKIAELINSNEVNNLDNISFSSQELFFVDDLIINDKSLKKISHYQIKNVQSLSWGDGGFKTLADDFRVQIKLNKSLNLNCRCYLVISNESLIGKLQSTLPKTIEENTEVLFFLYDSVLTSALSKNTEFFSAIEKICVNKDRDKVESVATTLIGVWIASGKKNITLKSILEAAIKSSPSFVRPLGTKFDLKETTKAILNNIKDFTYNTDRGFLDWNYKAGLETGILPYSCVTEKFEKFEKILAEQHPLDFNSLEPFLI